MPGMNQSDRQRSPRAAQKSYGVEQIAAAFARAKDQGRAALIPYYTLGFPTPEVSLQVIEAIAAEGADLIELGVPFSDPLADGLTIQHSTQVALDQGVSPQRCLEMAAKLRACGVSQPMIFMGYMNPMLAFGLANFVEQAADSGISGLIVPDLPPGEAADLEGLCRQHGLGLIYLASPNTTASRLQLIAGRTSGFLYLVSLTGVTGARTELPSDLESFIKRARQVASTPVAVGFGISTPQQAAAVGRIADGVIVGSALIRAAGSADNPPAAAAAFIASLMTGLHPEHEPKST